jgi:hypothetical protein
MGWSAWLMLVAPALVAAPPVAQSAAVPQKGSPPSADEREIVVTGRRTGAPLAAGEWEFEHSAVMQYERTPVGSGAVPMPPVALSSAKRWRFCLPSSPVEELVMLLLVRGSDGKMLSNCSRMFVAVKSGNIHSTRRCSVNYYTAKENVSPFGDASQPAPDERSSMLDRSITRQRQYWASRNFTTAGEYTPDSLWLRFESRIELSGSAGVGDGAVQSTQSTMTGHRVGTCPSGKKP